MAKYHDPAEYLAAAESPHTSAEELGNLAQSEYDFVRTAVARHPSTPAEVLSGLLPPTLTTWNAQALTAELAKNENTSIETLTQLGVKLVPYCREADSPRANLQMGFEAAVRLCCNPRVPFETIARMLKADATTRQFRKVVARETSRIDVLELLVEDRSALVRRRARQRLTELQR